MSGQGVMWLALVGFGITLLGLATVSPLLAGMWLVAGSWLTVLCFTVPGEGEHGDDDAGH